MGSALAAVGLVTAVVGAFLPWLRSGTVSRSSYQVLAFRGFAGLDDTSGEVIRAIWVAVIPLAVCSVLLWALHLHRIAAIFVLLFGTMTGTVAALAAVQGGNEGALVGISLIGPVTTLGGAVLAVAGAITALTAPARAAIISPGGAP
ncbi:hypothetical protein [Saccharothrix coeruleofusca]|uniref:Uncharacterized protein n=1 Tax=Saccharothrix coeruleofusca TaxID=33919 RepID=A0A918AP26_9PSEU|nr:hypothetical protein [Saccharothrix coeruleofusca]MBP2337070.1 hypothetical protein [Saccharothrix coeruleofusca]GGP67375.1 hypothetical protein GCM10010185_45300 [Saccharothrix coeruleofusca]